MRRGCAAAACVLLTGIVGLSASQDRAGSLSGVITDTTGRGLPGATITAVAEQGEAAPDRHQFGWCISTGWTTGSYRVEARMNGFVTKMAETVIGSGQDRDRADVARRRGVRRGLDRKSGEAGDRTSSGGLRAP